MSSEHSFVGNVQVVVLQAAVNHRPLGGSCRRSSPAHTLFIKSKRQHASSTRPFAASAHGKVQLELFSMLFHQPEQVYLSSQALFETPEG